MLKVSEPQVAGIIIRTCCRCGGEFRTSSGRVCSECRKPRPGATTPELSLRESQIAQLVGEAKLNKEIAYELRLTEGTVKEYLNRIFRKLGMKNRTELALWTVRRNMEAA